MAAGRGGGAGPRCTAVRAASTDLKRKQKARSHSRCCETHGGMVAKKERRTWRRTAMSKYSAMLCSSSARPSLRLQSVSRSIPARSSARTPAPSAGSDAPLRATALRRHRMERVCMGAAAASRAYVACLCSLQRSSSSEKRTQTEAGRCSHMAVRRRKCSNCDRRVGCSIARSGTPLAALTCSSVRRTIEAISTVVDDHEIMSSLGPPSACALTDASVRESCRARSALLT